MDPWDQPEQRLALDDLVAAIQHSLTPPTHGRSIPGITLEALLNGAPSFANSLAIGDTIRQILRECKP